MASVPTTQKDTIRSTDSPIITDSGGQSGESTQHLKTSRMAILRRAYEERISKDPRVLDLMTASVKPTSSSNYQSKWSYFVKFIKENCNSEVNNENIFKFFTHLFYDRKVQPTTAVRYRTAISKPLKELFNIIISNNDDIQTLFQGMNQKRPKTAIPAPLWSLNKVLVSIDDRTGHLTLQDILQKTAFLLLLATAWRISELQACVRDKEFCFINTNNTLLIRPHNAFLAKNESPETRWQHKSIPALQLPDGTPSHLCPVRSLQEYLRRTSRVKTGPLFLHPATQKPMSVYQLSTTVCKLIHMADPSVKATIHDVRKYAASQSLLETMKVSEVIEAVNWKSPHTFWKHYMFPAQPLIRQAVLPGVASSSRN